MALTRRKRTDSLDSISTIGRSTLGSRFRKVMYLYNIINEVDQHNSAVKHGIIFDKHN